AEQLDRILPDNIKPTVVIMNPPFSTALNMDKKNSDNVKKHIGQALDRLQDNGRAVIIAGNTLAEGRPKFSGWWSEIKGKYNVKANVTIDGENYRKYGTTFDIQLIVIDKNGPTQDKTITGNFKNLEDVINILEGVRNERPEIRNNQGVPRSEQATNKPSGIKDDAEIRPTMGTGIRNDSNSTSGDGSIGNRGGMADTTGKGNNQGNNADGNDRGPIQQTGDIGLSETDNRGDIERGGTEDSGRRDTSDEVIGTVEQLPNKQHGSDIDGIKDTVKVKNKKSEKVNIDLDENRVFEIYRPEKLDIKDAQSHPAELVESAAMSAVSPPDITYSPAIPNDIIKKGLLSDAQMEAVVYAGQAHSQTLPSGVTKGYYIGDGTGVGKGREIAGIIYDNYLQGRKKAVWITMNTDLIKDAKRDIEGIGWKDVNVISNLKKGEKIKAKEGVLVTTYGTISSSFSKEVVNSADGYKLNKDNRIQQIYEWLGKDFDGVIAFDEAHKMKSGLSVKKARGKSKPSDTALAGIALQELFPKAKIVYVSATNAVNVEDLAYGQRLGLWGEGTAFPTVEAFVSEISKGGVAAMELVSRDMKSMGLYTARNISFNGVSYERLEHKLTNEQRVVYNKIAEAWQIILKNVNAAIEATQAQGKNRGSAYSAFWSSNQRFFNQILTSMQMPSVLADIKKQLADGKSVVLQIVSTNEASLERKISNAIEEGLSPDEMDLTPRELLINYLEKSFPV
ncbi:MAG: DEAD/DEAH box helicase family protein, partial [Epulopiscium sp.]|nr:DEAD/DEAH box helicase family protein [Candidatus Epulonipiscium sp.]